MCDGAAASRFLPLTLPAQQTETSSHLSLLHRVAGTLSRAGVDVARYMLFDRASGTGAGTVPVIEQLKIVTSEVALGELLSTVEVIDFPDEAECRAALARGARVYVVIRKRQLVHYSWVADTPSAAGLDHLLRALRSRNAVLIGPCWTSPAARGQGLYPAVLRRICQDAAERGLRHVRISSRLSNHASGRGIRKAGFEPTRMVYYLRVAGHGLHLVSPFRASQA